ncbi:phage tail tape measure protein [Streptomyces sp. NPDC058299]|uniref:phage tail tape measure protein n=1 Tax=Streptomyces sp. NPDC058299 TaxID=3346435 RepID=UPI0036E4E76A
MSGGGALLPPVVVRLMGDMTQLRGTLAQARTQVDGTARGFQAAGATAFAGLARMGRSVSLVGAGVAVASVKMAGDFQAQTMVLHTAAGETLKGLSTVRQGILDIASGTGTDWHNLTDGMYQVEKAGYRGADGLKVLKAAAQGAREENAELDTVTNAMTSVMASYHLKASDSVRVMNGLKTAAGEGKMTMEQFAGSLSTVLPIASANKISFEEVTGALATLTQHGTSAREGTQELGATIRALASPNNVATQEMARFGLSATDVSTKIGKRGLTGTLDLLTSTVLSKMGKSGTVLLSAFNNSKQAAAASNEMIRQMPKGIQGLARSYSSGSISLGDWRQKLKELSPDQANLLQQYAVLQNKSKGFSDALKKGGPAAETYTQAIKKMAGGAIGLNTTLQLTGESSDGFKERVKKVGESYNHASKDVEGWDATQKLFNVQLAKAKQTISVVAIEIGTKLIPVVTAVIGWFGRHKDVAVALAAVIGGVLALSVVAYAAKLAMSAAKTVKAFAQMGASAVKGSANIVRGFRSASAAADDATGMAGTFGGKLRKGFDAAVSGAKSAGGAVKSFALSVGRASATAGRAAWSGLVAGVRGVGTAMKTASVQALAFMRSMAASALAGLRAAAAWTAQKVALIASAIAERAAALAQWALNVAMSANPVTIIVIGLMALIGVLVLAYNKIAWFRNFVNSAFHAIGAAIGWVVGFVKANWPAILTLLTGPIGIAVLTIVKYWGKIKAGFVAMYHGTVAVGKSLVSWIAGLPGRAQAALSALGARVVSVASSAWSRFKSATVQKVADLLGYVRALPSRIKAGLGNLGSLLLSAGMDLIRGMIHGITSMAGAAIAKVKSVGSSMVSGMKSVLGIHSPSRVFRQLGYYVNQGLVDGLTGSTARVKAATRRIETLLMQTYNKVADLKHTRGVGKGWVKSHEATIKKLQAYAKREDAVLRALATKRDSVAKKLKSAQKHLKDLQKRWSDEVKSVADGIKQGFTIVTEAPQEGVALTSQDVVNKMRDQMQKATQFAAQLQLLKKKGLSASLIAQIAAAGADQGGATAAALANATKGQIDEINKLNKKTNTAADSAGKAVADAMYGNGIKAAKGLVKGLQSQEKAIEKQMLKIAKAMQKAIKNALGIKSPSRVFAAIGQWIPRGLAAGVNSGTTHATRAVHRLAGSVIGAGAGAFTGSGLAVSGAAGRGTVVYNTVHVQVEGHVLTEKKLRDVVEKQMLQLGMRNPRTYAPYRR